MQSVHYRHVLRAFKQLCYASRDLPDRQVGRIQVWKVKAWLRSNPDGWNERSVAFIRYQQKELQAIIKFAKYRAMKRRYYD